VLRTGEDLDSRTIIREYINGGGIIMDISHEKTNMVEAIHVEKIFSRLNKEMHKVISRGFYRFSHI
jgi:hypothetical protein